MPTMSFLSDQMQKHLLSSTLQSNSSKRASSSPTNISTTPALAYGPTPSPSPFISDLGFSLDKTRTNYEQGSAASCSAELAYSQSSQAAGQPDVKLVLVESATTSIPSSIALLTPQPIGLIQPSSSQSQSSILIPPSQSFNDTVSSTQFSSQSSIPIIHPNKKKRLLTFLTEQQNSICSVTDNSQIILTPSKPEQILFNSAKTDQILINPQPKSETPLSSQPQTLILQPCVTNITGSAAINPQPKSDTLILQPAIDNVKPDQTTLIIPAQPPQPKNESTLIFNSEGAATLITPVTAAPLLTPITPAPPSGSFTLVQPAPTVDILSVTSQAGPNVLNQVTLSSSSAPTLHTLVQPLSTSAPPPAIHTLVQPASSVDIVSVFPDTKSAPGHNLQPLKIKNNYEQYAEKVMCYKCKLCGYLVTNNSALKHHVIDDHDDVVTHGDENDSEGAWLDLAIKAGILLNCSLCTNTFKSVRSFSVHMTDDHSLTDHQAEVELDKRNKERKERALELLKDRRRKEKEERKKRRELTYEAYMDQNNEIKVRKPKILKNNELKNLNVAEYPQDSNIVSPPLSVSPFSTSPNQDMKILKVPKHFPGRERTPPTKLAERVYRKIAPAAAATIVKKTEEVKKYHCHIRGCLVTLADRDKMNLHIQSHHGRIFQCPLAKCDKETRLWSGMRHHLWSQHEYDTELWQCPHPGCQYRCTATSKLERHKLKHSEDRPWLCPICAKAFKLAKQLRLHTSACHGDADQASGLTCQVCKVSFVTPRQLRSHVEAVHQKKRNFLCTTCGYSAGSKSTLKLHSRKHTGDKPFACDQCQYSSSDHNALRRHKMRHSGRRPYKCPYCPYSSIQSTTYKIHLKSKHAVEDVSNILYQCNKCVFKTVKENIYLMHVAKHES